MCVWVGERERENQCPGFLVFCCFLNCWFDLFVDLCIFLEEYGMAQNLLSG